MSGALIVNPFASGVTEALVERVAAALPRPLDVRYTTHAGAAVELARELDGTVDAIYVFSGDGTYNEVVNGVAGRSALGFLPGGGTSVLSRALGLPRDPVEAAQRLAAGRRRRISLGRANGRRFTFSAGVGFDAELVRQVDRLGRRPDGRRPGDAVFMREAVRVLARHRFRLEPALEVAGLGRAAFAVVANCTPYTYAGRAALTLVPGASFEGGLGVFGLEQVRLRELPLLWLHGLRVRGLEGRDDAVWAPDLDRLEIRCDRPLPLQVDGEDLGDTEELTLVAERGAVEVLV